MAINNAQAIPARTPTPPKPKITGKSHPHRIRSSMIYIMRIKNQIKVNIEVDRIISLTTTVKYNVHRTINSYW